ncbi:hypothetical protein O3P69_011995 [Scylla paramamosain]|uniref:Uncharacterized protein n=1 Tax=Scylla paramamosain TaxID=85552 RepID=A0AAW0SF11_SCYPA
MLTGFSPMGSPSPAAQPPLTAVIICCLAWEDHRHSLSLMSSPQCLVFVGFMKEEGLNIPVVKEEGLNIPVVKEEGLNIPVDSTKLTAPRFIFHFISSSEPLKASNSCQPTLHSSALITWSLLA